MTNEEIREKWFFPKYSYRLEGRGTPDCYPTELIFNNAEFIKAIQAIQDLTRADERDRVIEDIKETLTRLYVNDIDITDLYCAMIKELNSLKENK